MKKLFASPDTPEPASGLEYYGPIVEENEIIKKIYIKLEGVVNLPFFSNTEQKIVFFIFRHGHKSISSSKKTTTDYTIWDEILELEISDEIFEGNLIVEIWNHQNIFKKKEILDSISVPLETLKERKNQLKLDLGKNSYIELIIYLNSIIKERYQFVYEKLEKSIQYKNSFLSEKEKIYFAENLFDIEKIKKTYLSKNWMETLSIEKQLIEDEQKDDLLSNQNDDENNQQK